MKPKRTYIPEQYTCFTSKSPSPKQPSKIHSRKKSIDKSNKKAVYNDQYSNSSSKKSFQKNPLQSSRQKFMGIGGQYKRLRSITQFSNLKEKKSCSKSKIKTKAPKPSQDKLAKQNIRLKKALKESEQQKQVLSQKLQFFKSNMKSPSKPDYIPKLSQLSDLVKSLKKTYQQNQLSSKLPLQSVFKSRLRTQIEGQSLTKSKSKAKIQSIIKNIEAELKEIQGHKQMFQNFTNSK